jgi:hypothetical protein
MQNIEKLPYGEEKSDDQTRIEEDVLTDKTVPAIDGRVTSAACLGSRERRSRG